MADSQGVIDRPEQLTREIPADIPLSQAVDMIKAIAERQRAGLIAAVPAAGSVGNDENA